MNKITTDAIEWIKNYFKTTNGRKAVIGISGGKDSTVAAALCVEALGKDNVIGVMMPNGVQSDIKDSEKIIDFLGIKGLVVNNKIIRTGEKTEHFEEIIERYKRNRFKLEMINLPRFNPKLPDYFLDNYKH